MVGIGEVELTGVNVDPREVTPGGTVQITARLTETAEFVGPFGKLRLCNPPTALSSTGLEVDVVFEAGWTQGRRDTVCVPVFNTASGETEVVYTLTAPDPSGEFDTQSFPFSVHIESTKNDEVSQPINNEVVVSTGSGAVDEPQEPDSDGNRNLLTWASQNPGVALALGIGGVVAVRTAVESLVPDL